MCILAFFDVVFLLQLEQLHLQLPQETLTPIGYRQLAMMVHF